MTHQARGHDLKAVKVPQQHAIGEVDDQERLGPAEMSSGSLEPVSGFLLPAVVEVIGDQPVHSVLDQVAAERVAAASPGERLRRGVYPQDRDKC